MSTSVIALTTDLGSHHTASAGGMPHALTLDQQHPGLPPRHLTARQLEVLALLCEGLPNKLICRRLDIAAGTVKAHISSILRELGVTSRLQAVIVARGLKLVDDA